MNHSINFKGILFSKSDHLRTLAPLGAWQLSQAVTTLQRLFARPLSVRRGSLKENDLSNESRFNLRTYHFALPPTIIPLLAQTVAEQMRICRTLHSGKCSFQFSVATVEVGVKEEQKNWGVSRRPKG